MLLSEEIQLQINKVPNCWQAQDIRTPEDRHIFPLHFLKYLRNIWSLSDTEYLARWIFALVYHDGICFADMSNWKDFNASLGIAAFYSMNRL